MPQIINTNIASLNAQRNLNASQRDQDTALQRLSSGLRINSAKDDAAGLAISTRFDAQIRGTSVAARNSGDAISLAQTAEGALESINTSLQRVRELALQSANDTNSAVDRQALQEEVNQLVSEIESVAKNANFNGRNLLDGSFQNATFQTGANVGQTVSVSIGEISAETLGSAKTSGLSSSVSQTALTGTATDALVAGDVIVNGVSIGASSGTVDTASSAFGSSSSIAKAAAINAASEQTGVTATVNVNTAEGTTVANGANAVAATDISINGQTVSLSKAATGDAIADLAGVATAINEQSGATGVQATVVETDTGARIDLSAEDGRNITIGGTAAATLGLAAGLGTVDANYTATAGNTYTGDYTLNSVDGSDIKLSTNTGDIDNAGFEAGSFSGNTAGAVGDEVAAAALAAGDLTINGVAIGASKDSDDNASTLADNGVTAIAKAAAINKVADKTGVTASVNETTVLGGAITGTTAGGFEVTINDVVIEGTTTDDAIANQSTIVDAINAKSGQTGVTAEIIDSNKLYLTAKDGRAIEITAGTAGDTGLSTGNNEGSITLSSAGKIDIGTNTGNNDRAGFNVGSFGGAESGARLKDLDISTVQGAEKAITAVDNALATVASRRAELGAIQNRFESTISNLEINRENLSAANSRIQDADFATETAALSKSQVLQQAGISVLAQANGRPQQVLSLLQ